VEAEAGKTGMAETRRKRVEEGERKKPKKERKIEIKKVAEE